jgi:hypothetical protein
MSRRNESQILNDLSFDERLNIAALVNIFEKKRYIIKRFIKGETCLTISSQNLKDFADYLYNSRQVELSRCLSRAERERYNQKI